MLDGIEAEPMLGLEMREEAAYERQHQGQSGQTRRDEPPGLKPARSHRLVRRIHGPGNRYDHRRGVRLLEGLRILPGRYGHLAILPARAAFRHGRGLTADLRFAG
ncbi:hypothetical protein [Amycolatopsis sp. cmx-4-54]|uniref:hypothetical protein n=1 Tax=Amycolatopsis sp. cmx-4-54 TaxID=2790936 RepID=UPI00397992C2